MNLLIQNQNVTKFEQCNTRFDKRFKYTVANVMYVFSYKFLCLKVSATLGQLETSFVRGLTLKINDTFCYTLLTQSINVLNRSEVLPFPLFTSNIRIPLSVLMESKKHKLYYYVLFLVIF